MAQYNLYWGTYGSAPALSTLASALSSLPSSVAAMGTINEAGGVKCWLLPYYDADYVYKVGYTFAVQSVCVRYAVGDWSDIPENAETATITFSGNTYQVYTDTRANGSVSLDLFNELSDTTPLVTLVADEYKGVAEFNISNIVLGLMSQEMSELYQSDIVPVIDETYLYKCVYVGKYNNKTSDQYMFIRANAVVDGYSYIDVQGSCYLLSDEKVYRGGGHYSCVAILIPNDGITRTYEFVSGITTNLYAGKVYILRVIDDSAMAAINGLIYNHETGQQIEWADSFNCKAQYVRWVNRTGGVDYFAFVGRQIVNNSVKTSKTSLRMYRNGTILSVPENIPYEITQTQILKLGAENVSEEHIDKLNDFAHSSYMQIFDDKEYATKKWKRCSVDKYDIKRKTDASALNYEIELNIPEPNILF